ncbi:MULTISPECIES: hypothetical protein [unclassified Streptomyces]|uniref:hypothetical protein n=1 Tax=unclassified Streptomyces TaxID=2593676 RepID=UPI0036A1B785
MGNEPLPTGAGDAFCFDTSEDNIGYDKVIKPLPTERTNGNRVRVQGTVWTNENKTHHRMTPHTRQIWPRPGIAHQLVPTAAPAPRYSTKTRKRGWRPGAACAGESSHFRPGEPTR